MDLSLKLAEGLTSRPATLDDVDAVTALIIDCELDADGAAEIDRDDILSDLQRPALDLERDTLLVLEGGALAAWAQVYQGRRAEADVHPGYRSRGIGSAVLGWTEARAREVGGTALRQTVTDANASAIELLRRSGYEPGYTSWILEIALEEEPPEPAVPDGIRLRDFVPGRDDRDVYRLIDDAFNEWPLRDPSPFDEWAAVTIARETFAPDLSPLAIDGDELVGAALSLDYGPHAEGYVHQVAVERSHRNRGIARALLLHAFRAFHRKGRRACILSTDSRTGALGLYESVGMHVRRSYTSYRKQL